MLLSTELLFASVQILQSWQYTNIINLRVTFFGRNRSKIGHPLSPFQRWAWFKVLNHSLYQMKWGAIYQDQHERTCPIFVVTLFLYDGIALDQNFPASSSIGYVNLPVTSDMPLSSNLCYSMWNIDRNFYSTVSLPQNIVGSIDVFFMFLLDCSNHKKLYLLCMFIIQTTFWTRTAFLCNNPIHPVSLWEGFWQPQQMCPTQLIVECQFPMSPPSSSTPWRSRLLSREASSRLQTVPSRVWPTPRSLCFSKNSRSFASLISTRKSF